MEKLKFPAQVPDFNIQIYSDSLFTEKCAECNEYFFNDNPSKKSSEKVSRLWQICDKKGWEGQKLDAEPREFTRNIPTFQLLATGKQLTLSGSQLVTRWSSRDRNKKKGKIPIGMLGYSDNLLSTRWQIRIFLGKRFDVSKIESNYSLREHRKRSQICTLFIPFFAPSFTSFKGNADVLFTQIYFLFQSTKSNQPQIHKRNYMEQALLMYAIKYFCVDLVKF